MGPPHPPPYKMETLDFECYHCHKVTHIPASVVHNMKAEKYQRKWEMAMGENASLRSKLAEAMARGDRWMDMAESLRQDGEYTVAHRLVYDKVIAKLLAAESSASAGETSA